MPGLYTAFQHDLPVGTDPIEDGVGLDVLTSQTTLAVDHDGARSSRRRCPDRRRKTPPNTMYVLMLARLGREGSDDRVIERDSDLGGGA